MSNQNNPSPNPRRGRWVQSAPRDFSPGPGVRAIAVNWNYREKPVFVEDVFQRYADAGLVE